MRTSSTYRSSRQADRRSARSGIRAGTRAGARPNVRSDPPWILSMADMMMLLLTFFITLVALSSVNERSRRVMVDSVSKVFGIDAMRHNAGERGAGAPDSAALRDPLLAELRGVLDSGEVRLRRNELVVTVSIGGAALFEPGSATLTPDGENMLGRMLPYVMKLQYPMLVAGHSSPRMDEEGPESRFNPFGGFGVTGDDAGWRLSAARAQAVYRYYTANGVPPGMLRMEAYGEFQPLFSNHDEEGRAKNRRVELVLDKRDPSLKRAGDALRLTPAPGREYFFRDFRFDLDYSHPDGINPRLENGGGR